MHNARSQARLDRDVERCERVLLELPCTDQWCAGGDLEWAALPRHQTGNLSDRALFNVVALFRNLAVEY